MNLISIQILITNLIKNMRSLLDSDRKTIKDIYYIQFTKTHQVICGFTREYLKEYNEISRRKIDLEELYIDVYDNSIFRTLFKTKRRHSKFTAYKLPKGTEIPIGIDLYYDILMIHFHPREDQIYERLHRFLRIESISKLNWKKIGYYSIIYPKIYNKICKMPSSTKSKIFDIFCQEKDIYIVLNTLQILQLGRKTKEYQEELHNLLWNYSRFIESPYMHVIDHYFCSRILKTTISLTNVRYKQMKKEIGYIVLKRFSLDKNLKYLIFEYI